MWHATIKGVTARRLRLAMTVTAVVLGVTLWSALWC